MSMASLCYVFTIADNQSSYNFKINGSQLSGKCYDINQQRAAFPIAAISLKNSFYKTYNYFPSYLY